MLVRGQENVKVSRGHMTSISLAGKDRITGGINNQGIIDLITNDLLVVDAVVV